MRTTNAWLLRWRDTSFRTKLLTTYLALALFPLLILTTWFSVFMRQNTENTVIANTSQMIEQVGKHIDFYISSIEKQISFVAHDETVLAFLRGQQESQQDAQRISNMLQNLLDAHQEMAGMMIVSAQDTMISARMNRLSREPLIDESWYTQALQAPNEVQLIANPIGRNIATSKAYSADEVFSLAHAVMDPTSGRPLGVVLIDVRHDIVQEAIRDITFGKKGFVFIADRQGSIVWTPVNPVVYRVQPLLETATATSPTRVSVDDEDYQIIYQDSAYTGWRMVGVFSIGEMMASVNTVTNLSVLGFVTLVLLALPIALYTASSVTKPIRKLSNLMRQAEDGNLEVRFASKSQDEIGRLGSRFNRMLEQIQRLIERVNIEQKSKREAELRTLQAQIKPHFLYNTLDTIAWLAREHDAQDVVSLVGALTSLFRISLSDGKEIIPVEEEQKHLVNYLFIQRTRYKERLVYQIDIAPEICDCMVPKLILQPLVENAIYHGVKMRKKAGNVRVSGQRVADEVVFTVTDDGPGIAPETLLQLQAMLADRDSAAPTLGYGLFNVNERIRLTCGPSYGLSIQSNPGQGTQVTVCLPYQSQPERRDA